MLRTEDLELRAIRATVDDVRAALKARRRPWLAGIAAYHVARLLGSEWVEDAARARIEARVRDRAAAQLDVRERARLAPGGEGR